MSHEIFDANFLSVREPAWHKCGKSWTGPKTAVEAADESGVAAIRLATRRMGWQAEDGTFEPVDDRVVIVRLPTPGDPRTVRVGEASEGYSLIQNSDIARALDESGLTSRWPVETVGALGQGETLFICLAMGGDQIVGEPHQKYVLITDTRDGSSALQVITCFTRVVCANTLQIALGEGETKVSLLHSAHIETDFRFSLDIMEHIERQAQHVKAALERLHEIAVPRHELPDLWEQVYPDPPRGTLLRQYERVDNPTAFDPATLARLEKMRDRWSYERGLRQTLRETAADRYEVLCRDYPLHRDTALGVFNAVAEVADHARQNRKGSAAVITGFRADEKIRAYRILSAMVTD